MLTSFLILLIVVLAGGLFAALRKIICDRANRKMRFLWKPWPISRVTPDIFDPRFAVSALGPAWTSEIRFITNFRVEGGISDLETWILCNLAKTANRIFELGTCTGKTTYLLAANAPAEARVTTLTLKPEHVKTYQKAANDDDQAHMAAAAESYFTHFFYEGRPEQEKIEQLFGDSKMFDETPHNATYDLIFVDGSHARSYVESDSRKALAMVAPGGIVIWHDYCGPRRAPGVFQALNALAQEISLVHIAGTSFIAYRKPVAA